MFIRGGSTSYSCTHACVMSRLRMAGGRSGAPSARIRHQHRGDGPVHRPLLVCLLSALESRLVSARHVYTNSDQFVKNNQVNPFKVVYSRFSNNAVSNRGSTLLFYGSARASCFVSYAATKSGLAPRCSVNNTGSTHKASASGGSKTTAGGGGFAWSTNLAPSTPLDAGEQY